MLAKVNTLQCNGGALKLKGAGHERGRRRCFDAGVVASALYAVGDDVTAQYNCSKAQPAVESNRIRVHHFNKVPAGGGSRINKCFFELIPPKMYIIELVT